MNTLDEIKDAISQLPEEQSWTLKDWLEELCSDLWDKEIERDAKNGNLDKLWNALKDDSKAGRRRDL